MAIKRDPETEAFIRTLKDNETYLFMRSEFDKITNDGDNYDAEVHDAQVMKSAAEKFNITESEADNIYVGTEMAIADFHKKRLNK